MSRPEPVSLAARDIHLSFGSNAVLRGVTLDVPAGTTAAIIGPSGSGKSTLLRSLNRLYEPDRGDILLDGRSVLADDPDKLRQRIGMVFQHFNLFPHMTVLENVLFPLGVRKIGGAEADKLARDALKLVRLDGLEARRPSQLSGGQQQRVGIARPLVVEPELWFLDEPFSALDPLIRREMQDELLRLQARLQKTIVFITHDLDEALLLGDHIAILKDGELRQIGAQRGQPALGLTKLSLHREQFVVSGLIAAADRFAFNREVADVVLIQELLIGPIGVVLLAFDRVALFGQQRCGGVAEHFATIGLIGLDDLVQDGRGRLTVLILVGQLDHAGIRGRADLQAPPQGDDRSRLLLRRRAVRSRPENHVRPHDLHDPLMQGRAPEDGRLCLNHVGHFGNGSTRRVTSAWLVDIFLAHLNQQAGMGGVGLGKGKGGKHPYAEQHQKNDQHHQTLTPQERDHVVPAMARP